MKSNKSLLRAATIASLVASVLLPLAVSAAAVNAPERTGRGSAFCNSLETGASNIANRMQGRKTNLETLRTNADQAGQSRKADQEARLQQIRNENDARTSDLMGKLDEFATSDVQKAAVSAFQRAVQAAVTARRDAIDAANKAFQDGLQAAITDRQSKVDAAVATFTAAVTAALDKAKADCASGVSATTVRETLMSAITAARQQLQTDRQSLAQISATVASLRDARRAAMDKAKSDFLTAMNDAKVALKAALAPSTNAPAGQ